MKRVLLPLIHHNDAPFKSHRKLHRAHLNVSRTCIVSELVRLLDRVTATRASGASMAGLSAPPLARRVPAVAGSGGYAVMSCPYSVACRTYWRRVVRCPNDAMPRASRNCSSVSCMRMRPSMLFSANTASYSAMSAGSTDTHACTSASVHFAMGATKAVGSNPSPVLSSVSTGRAGSKPNGDAPLRVGVPRPVPSVLAWLPRLELLEAADRLVEGGCPSPLDHPLDRHPTLLPPLGLPGDLFGLRPPDCGGWRGCFATAPRAGNISGSCKGEPNERCPLPMRAGLAEPDDTAGARDGGGAWREDRGLHLPDPPAAPPPPLSWRCACIWCHSACSRAYNRASRTSIAARRSLRAR
eukprot:m.403659 g.403659  ORF g.403659 m.403659 type:complete len:354 (+) comp21193_c1_seq17:3428-4489(+)